MTGLIRLISIAASIWLVWQIFNRWIWPLWLMARGEFELVVDLFKDRAAHAEDQETKNDAYYNIANCYFRQGKYPSSVSWLDKIDTHKLTEELCGKYYSLFANNLIMTRNDLELAGRYLEKARPTMDPDNYSIYKCHLELLLNNRQIAEQLFPLMARKKKKFFINMNSLHPDTPFNNLMKNYVSGMYHRAYGDPKLAEKYLKKATIFPYRNGISEHARELLGVKMKTEETLVKSKSSEDIPVKIVKYFSGKRGKKEI